MASPLPPLRSGSSKRLVPLGLNPLSPSPLSPIAPLGSSGSMRRLPLTNADPTPDDVTTSTPALAASASSSSLLASRVDVAAAPAAVDEVAPVSVARAPSRPVSASATRRDRPASASRSRRTHARDEEHEQKHEVALEHPAEHSHKHVVEANETEAPVILPSVPYELAPIRAPSPMSSRSSLSARRRTVDGAVAAVPVASVPLSSGAPSSARGVRHAVHQEQGLAGAVSPHHESWEAELEAELSQARPAASRSRPNSARRTGLESETRPIAGGGTRFPSVVRGVVGPIDPHVAGSQNRPSLATSESFNARALAAAASTTPQPHLHVTTESPSARRPSGAGFNGLPSPAPSPAPSSLRSPSPDSDIETSFSPVGQPVRTADGRPPAHPSAAGAAAAASPSAALSSPSAVLASSRPLRLHPSPTLNLSPPWVEPSHGESVLTVWTGTWNLHAKPFPDNLSAWIPRDAFDLYVVGTEECEASIEASLIFSSKARWTKRISELLGPGYVEVAQQTLQAIHIIAFIRTPLFSYVHKIETGSVATGLGQVVGNKGGVGIGFDVSDTSFLFINAHFAAHQTHVEQRNADFRAINRKLMLRRRMLARPTTAHLVDVCDRFDRVFWLGDLNYRIGGNRRMVDALIAKGMIEVLVSNDQLNLARERGEVFQGFIEGDIAFMPTYKFDNLTDRYDTSKKRRIPSYTDRILWKADSAIALLAYDSVNEVKTSDHRPVYATFKVRVTQHDDASQIKQYKYEQSGSKACVIQ